MFLCHFLAVAAVPRIIQEFTFSVRNLMVIGFHSLPCWSFNATPKWSRRACRCWGYVCLPLRRRRSNARGVWVYVYQPRAHAERPMTNVIGPHPAAAHGLMCGVPTLAWGVALRRYLNVNFDVCEFDSSLA